MDLRKPIARESISPNLGTYLNPVPAATGAMVTVLNGSIRWTTDGSLPTSTTGTLMKCGDVELFENNLLKLRFTSVNGTTVAALLDVSYFGP